MRFTSTPPRRRRRRVRRLGDRRTPRRQVRGSHDRQAASQSPAEHERRCGAGGTADSRGRGSRRHPKVAAPVELAEDRRSRGVALDLDRLAFLPAAGRCTDHWVLLVAPIDPVVVRRLGAHCRPPPSNISRSAQIRRAIRSWRSVSSISLAPISHNTRAKPFRSSRGDLFRRFGGVSIRQAVDLLLPVDMGGHRLFGQFYSHRLRRGADLWTRG